MPNYNIELIFDAIAEALITSDIVDQNLVLNNQKTITNGIISLGRSNADKLILFEKDIKANKEDLEFVSSDVNEGLTLENILERFNDLPSVRIEGTNTAIQIFLDGFETGIDGDVGLTFDITSYLQDDNNNPINISQFVNIDLTSTDIFPEQANEFLDTNIYELLGGGRTRQDRINDFFIEFQNLTVDPPDFQITNGMVGIDFSSDDYSDLYDISSTTPEGNIPRLDIDEGEDNVGQTLQSLRDTLNTYLVDVDEQLDSLEDQRPSYQNKSDGYLKFRNLNQGIIIRNTNQEFVSGLDPNNPTWVSSGFTITMWVRFLDKVSSGTLFNYGNPTDINNPFGFRLETYVLNKDDEIDHGGADSVQTWGNLDTELADNNLNPDGGGKSWKPVFINDDSARFVKLVVNTKTPSSQGNLYDSHVGWTTKPKQELIDQTDNSRLLTTTNVPINFSEWYFICATYWGGAGVASEVLSYDKFPINIVGSESFLKCNTTGCNETPEFWTNNISEIDYTYRSNYGNSCKVEIISRSDLLRARGYNT